eukprot:GFUD01034815.1.p1 GENE.GFUD01034815.1~~GFUD01034815.1.p1  ORF type:complete len:419 (-),score=97.40 GFUD01034815.1:129-1385(-)
MPLLSYWTIPYVSIDDTWLVYLYNIGFVCVLGSLFGNILLYQTYLESDVLQGITEARLKTPINWSPATKEDPFCKENFCVKWDSDEVGYSYTSGSIFVATRIKDSLEKSTCDQETQAKFKALGRDEENDTIENVHVDLSNSEEDDNVLECAEYKRISKKKYYPFNVEDFYLTINAYAEALEFCSSNKVSSNPEEHFDEDNRESNCPYVYSMKTMPGELVSYNGTVLKHFNKDPEISSSLKKVPVSTFLEAAGVDGLSDKVIRDKGGVFQITVKFHLDYSKIGYFTGLLSSPEQEKLPTKFTVQVNKLAQAGYRVREVVGHTRTHRRVRTYSGLHFKLVVAGKAEKFSWSKLLSEIVLKFGLFGVISTILDLLWQIVFPLVGFPDYNDLVYKSVQTKDLNKESDFETMSEKEMNETDEQ